MVKGYMETAHKSAEFEPDLQQLTDEQLKDKTQQFKDRLANGESDRDILPEAFAVVREAATRNVQMRHFDVQLVGGNVLYGGKIAEMATGEGKTLVATLAVYMKHLTGKKVHIVTVNDYLATRDAEWMGAVYKALGLTVGAIHSDLDTMSQERKDQYACDVTYGTNNEFGFDYLRDNMKTSLEQMVQSDLQYAIVDEVDSILIDEARTPLIISGPAFDDTTRYKKADQVARQLIERQSRYNKIKQKIDSCERTIANAEGELTEAKKQKDKSRAEKAQKVLDKKRQELLNAEDELETATQYYEVELDKKQAHLTHEGIGAAQEIAGVGSFYTGSNMDWPHLLSQSLRAHITFEKEKDYVVQEGKVIIVDEFTGRLMHGRQWSDGLHQAVEAKENVEIKKETQTLATITLQNLFKLYESLSGMTGTAETEAGEFMNIYGLDVIVIPTNKPCIRDDREDVIYKSMAEKFNAITDDIYETSKAGCPVLVGSTSVEKSESLSAGLKKKYGIEHEVLNAKYHDREAAIVAKAGQQHKGRDGKMRGNVTIATNMAGRGTDIKLGEGVAEIGGLHVLGSERHEARRIDNQLRGRTGRQGDPGSSQFFLCFDDDLMRVFAPENTVKWLSWIGWEEGQPIHHKRISKGIEKAQKKVEERNFEIRKSLLEYDEVMDYQRKIFYSRRRDVLAGQDLKQRIIEMIDDSLESNCHSILDINYPLKCIAEWAKTNFAVEIEPTDLTNLNEQEIEESIKELAKDNTEDEISISLGEYLEDYADSEAWDIAGLRKWAMSAFKVNLSASKIKELTPDEIQEQLIEAAAEQIDKKDCSALIEFLREDFAAQTLVDWAKSKFDIRVTVDDVKELKPAEAFEFFREKTREKYQKREIEYPVEFAMSMVFGQQGPNVYAFEALAKWANQKYNAGLTAEQIQESSPRSIHNQLLELSKSYNNGKLEEEIDSQIKALDTEKILQWAKDRFSANIELTAQDSHDGQLREKLLDAGRRFMRKELADLEKYVLLQVYDSAWKEHLYNMDKLKESIWMRSLAQQDPKVEYKREGFRMFDEMLSNVSERVTDAIFKVRLEAGARAIRNIYQVSETAHDQVGQFSMAQQQRAAAQAPQGDQKVRQVKLKEPKVGRNDPCPCGSGKKYKKCCGKPV